jgi:hypothetical protein
MIEITVLTKTGGPLTKVIRLSPDGKIISDGSACVMARGRASRVRLPSHADFAPLINGLEQTQAIALGALRPGLPDHVEIVTKKRLTELNGKTPPNIVARTSGHIEYIEKQPTFALIDVDTKGMPETVAARIAALGGYWPALVSVMPQLATAAHIVRNSTSSGLSRSDTGEHIKGSDGQHIFILLQDGGDTERFLRTLHDRCWLHGFGWMMVGNAGQFLERSLIDRSVYAAERLVFESAPMLVAPLVQDRESRTPIVHDGSPLDSLTVCPPLTLVQEAKLKDLLGKEAHRLAPDSARVKSEFVKINARKLVDRTGMSFAHASRVIERQCHGVLLPTIALPFDDPDLADVTVADIIADPDRFVGATLADPLEGIGYGACKAKVMQRADGSLWINSFAHGQTTYEIKLDAPAVEVALNRAPPNETAALFVKLAVEADLDTDDIELLRNLTAARSGVTKRAIERKLKAAIKERHAERTAEKRQQRIAKRKDPRPQIQAPVPDAPWLPQMGVLNDVLGTSQEPEPPGRDVDGYLVAVRERRLPNMHALTSSGGNAEETEETRLPAPPQPLITRLEEPQIAELIERHVDYVSGEDARSVHLGSQFVRHYQQRHDDALPIVATVATLPIVMRDGTLLSEPGLDRDRGIVFRVPPELLAVLPKPEDCTPSAIAEAMAFLADEWLCDVTTSYAGKCTTIAAACTLIERSILPERPAFMLTAPRRGGGKTTLLTMVHMAAMGVRPSAAAWSTSDEERRKALVAYMLEGAPCIIWDNIVRGTQISCPHIERACTSELYTDRKLGVSELIAVSAAVIQFFTGNAISARGELMSRTLSIPINVDRADPENREFRHKDPVGWTEANRGRILRSLYMIMLGNPAIRPGWNGTEETRFKPWWRVVGSAVENAASQHVEHANAMAIGANPECKPEELSFRDLFLTQEEGDEDSSSLAGMLSAMYEIWPTGKNFSCTDLAKVMNDQSEYAPDIDRELAATCREFLYPKEQPNMVVTPKSLSKRLKPRLAEPVVSGNSTLSLRITYDKAKKVDRYWIRTH